MTWPKRLWWTAERASERGKVGGRASAIVRGKNRHTDDYKRGYQAGWKASERWFWRRFPGLKERAS